VTSVTIDTERTTGEAAMQAIEATRLTYRYGKHVALADLDLAVPQGALYALLGPNGSGKTTLLQILMGLRRPTTGRVSLLGLDAHELTIRERSTIAYIAEGQSLPAWMRLEQLESYLAPLYESWDPALANDLRRRFALDPRRKIGTLSRGEQMKAAMLCALAPRPRLLIMDEPFTGMDALVKDELVQGLLESAGSEGWTILLASHDIGELELLADWVGFLAAGRMQLSEPMEVLKQRFRRVEVTAPEPPPLSALGPTIDVWSVERSAARVSALVSESGPASVEAALRARVPAASHIEVRDASLREIFVALARRASRANDREVAA
jgi:ABC-2 type transport system ATP-binding protein